MSRLHSNGAGKVTVVGIAMAQKGYCGGTTRY
jgi:hypothetical protein